MILRDVAVAFPGVTTVRVKDALEAVGSVIHNLVLGIRGASLITLVAAALVLAGALAASPSQSRLRRHHPEDARSDTRQADRRIWARIYAAWPHHRPVRGGRRLGRCTAGRHARS